MDGKLVESSPEAILARLDKTTPQTLLQSIAQEFYRLEQLNALLAARLNGIESLQTIIDRIDAASSDNEMASYPRKVAFDASYSIPGSWGFNGLEYDEAGNPYRWTGPDRKFSFQFFLNRQADATFVLHFRKLYADCAVEDIRCFADGDEVEPAVSTARDGYVLTGVIPARETAGGTVLTFICPAVSSPAALGRGKDVRMLGLSFRTLRVTSLQPAANEAALSAKPLQTST